MDQRSGVSISPKHICLYWGPPSAQLEMPRRKSRRSPDTPRKRSQSPGHCAPRLEPAFFGSGLLIDQPELVMKCPAVLRVFLIYGFSPFWKEGYKQLRNSGTPTGFKRVFDKLSGNLNIAKLSKASKGPRKVRTFGRQPFGFQDSSTALIVFWECATQDWKQLQLIVFMVHGSNLSLLRKDLWHWIKVARLQSEFCTKDFFRATNFVTKNAPKFSPKFLKLCSVGQKKSPENSLQISH